MRVIAGLAKRAVLFAPEGLVTRPTADRSKESLFNILSSSVPGARVLDLYAGSGAMGIEALSRGAAEAVFVDQAKAAVDAITANLIKTGLAYSATVMRVPVKQALKNLASKMENRSSGFDIIFMDPPYGDRLIKPTLEIVAQYDLLTPGGLIVAEDEASEDSPTISQFLLYDSRTYGRTRFLFYKSSRLCPA